MELRNGVHKYQPIVLAAGSIAPEHRKSMIMPCYLRHPSGIFSPDKSQKCQVHPVPRAKGFGSDVTVHCVTLLSEIGVDAG